MVCKCVEEFCGTRGRSRTYGLLLRRQALYPLSYAGTKVGGLGENNMSVAVYASADYEL